MAEQAKIMTLRDHDTGEAVAPRTVVEAISGEGKKWNYVGFTEDNVLGVIEGTWPCNPNLLDNWYFVGGGSQQGGGQFPINQKAQREYDVTSLISQYTIDRWSTTFSSLSLEDDCILITSANTPSCSFAQYLEYPESYAGKTVTLSALFKEVSGTVQLTINPNSPTVPAKFDFVTEPGLASCTWTIPEDVQGFLYAGINIFQGGTARVIAIKLEFGAQQTLAHQENGVWVLNEIPDYATELAKCQRYLRSIYGDFVGFGEASFDGGGNWIRLSIQNAYMRAAPTVQDLSVGWVRSRGVQYQGKTTVVYSPAEFTPNSILIVFQLDDLTVSESGQPFEVAVAGGFLDANL